MSIPVKDQKLLWAKAAGECAFPNCNDKLFLESSGNLDSANVLIGEMAHIVGEMDTSPRGISPLTKRARNRYPNLVLLCPGHHTLVDQDHSNWPVELLRNLKKGHEIGVESRLGKSIYERERIYHNFIDRVGITFQLAHWELLCDQLFREIMPRDFPEKVTRLGFELFRAHLPGDDLAFERTLRNLIDRARLYVDHYTSNVEPDFSGKRLMKKTECKENKPELYKESLTNNRNWERNCTMLLFNLTHALNEFADVVRARLRPDFFLQSGVFCVYDTLGLMSESILEEEWHIPRFYYSGSQLEGFVKKQ